MTKNMFGIRFNLMKRISPFDFVESAISGLRSILHVNHWASPNVSDYATSWLLKN